MLGLQSQASMLFVPSATFGESVHGSLCMEKLPVLTGVTFCADYCKGSSPVENLPFVQVAAKANS